MKKVFILSVLSSLALITWAGQVEAVTVKLLPNDTRVRPVGWQSGTILFKMGQITIDDFDGGVKIGTLAVDTHLKIWNSTTSICFAGNTVIEFERAGGVLRGFICSETRMRIVYSSTWISFAKLSPVTFGYDSGVVSGVIAYDMDLPDAKGIARRYKANTMVNFNVKGQVESSMPWNGNITSSSGSPVGSWHNTINNRVSTWTITATADGTYFAQESGLGSAKGPAYFTQSGTFRIDYTFSGGSGFYEVRFSPDYNSAKGFCVDPSSTCTWVRINPNSSPGNENIATSSGSPVGSWHNTINNRVSTWTITTTPDGMYFAQESGLGSAKGPAYFTQSGTFRIDYTFSGGSGFYEVRFSPDYNSAKGFCVDPSSTCTWVRINQ